MKELPHSKGCFVCGARNSAGLKLRFHTDGNIVETRFTPETNHNGFVNVTHGGILATLLDEIMVWACGVQTRQFSYCAEMTVRYHSPSQPGQTLIARGEMTENKRGRMFIACGDLHTEDGRLVCSSTGKYMPVKDISFTSLLEDFEGSPEDLKRFFSPA